MHNWSVGLITLISGFQLRSEDISLADELHIQVVQFLVQQMQLLIDLPFVGGGICVSQGPGRDPRVRALLIFQSLARPADLLYQFCPATFCFLLLLVAATDIEIAFS